MPKLTEEEFRKKIEAYARAKDRGKKGYTAADALLDELIAGGLAPGKQIKLAAGRVAELVDQFATKNKVYKPAGVSRFDLRISHDS